MIDDVVKFLEQRIITEKIEQVRERVSGVQKHDYTIKKAVFLRIATDTIIKGINDYNAKHPTNPLTIDDMQVRQFVDLSTQKVLTVDNVFKAARDPSIFGSTFRKSQIEQKPGGLITLHLRVGQYDLKEGSMAAGQFIRAKSGAFALNKMMKNLVWQVTKEFKTKFKLYKNQNSSLQSSVNFNPSGILRAHGSTNLGGAKTTIASLTLSEGLDTAIQGYLAQKQEELTGDYSKFVEEKVTKFYNQLDAKYNVKDVQDMDFSKLKRDLVIEIEFGDAQHNKLMEDYDAGAIRVEIAKMRNSMVAELHSRMHNNPEEFYKLRGSKSFKDKTEEIAPALIVKKVKENVGKNFKQGKQSTVIQRRKTATSKTSTNKGKKAKTSTKKAVLPAARRLVKGKTKQSPLALANIINQYLPQTLKSMMIEPRLVYRTGRFANSAEVTGVYQGSRGGYSADYTYMKNPYQTFEPGFKMGSTYRDPRSIISGAIRDIAIREMGIKFGQVRRI